MSCEHLPVAVRAMGLPSTMRITWPDRTEVVVYQVCALCGAVFSG